ncbi:hypothetical protein [Pseudoclavibacter terrae]|nr:hypothetical protein [Pseudoclavibacter terrae]
MRCHNGRPQQGVVTGGPWLTAGAMLLLVVIFAPSLRRDRNE